MVYIEYEQICTVDERSDEEYGDWHQEFDFAVRGVYVDPPIGSYDKFEVPLEKGDTCYVVSFTYSDGDSFGCSRGNGEVAMVYRYLENANFAKGVIETSSDKNMKMHIPIERADGSIEVVKIGNPMYDYFTNLEDVIIDSFIVQ